MKLTKKGLRSYLESHRGKYFHNADATQCPIASYLKSMGYKEVRVGNQSVGYYRNGRLQRDDLLPVWAVKFICAFDNLKGYKHLGRTALKIMEGI